MDKVIAGYRCITPMRTAGSGSARWCLAMRGQERFFVKEFLSPVYPADPESALGKRQLERCRRFECRKQQLYEAASCVIGDTLVPVIDFFLEAGHYYAVSAAVSEGYVSATEIAGLSADEKRMLLYETALGLQRMHRQGIVHADLKPEHILFGREAGALKVKLIDLDSGFLLNDQPLPGKDVEGDPAFLAPEVFMRMTGGNDELSCAADIFSFGALIHMIWTGCLPGFDRGRYHYLYEAALDGGEIRLDLPRTWREPVRTMLHPDPACRPDAARAASLFAPKTPERGQFPVRNGLKGLLKG